MSEGWRCPVCNRGLSPNVQHCDHAGANLLGNPVAPFDPLQPGWPGYPYPPAIGIGINRTPGMNSGKMETDERLQKRTVYFSRDLQLADAGHN